LTAPHQPRASEKARKVLAAEEGLPAVVCVTCSNFLHKAAFTAWSEVGACE